MKGLEDHLRDQDFISDGATLPQFFRQWVTENYDPSVIERIDRAGRYHDWLVAKYPNTTTHNRRSFIKLITRYGIPTHLVRMIHVGLWIFDHCPKWIQDLMQMSAGR